MAEAKKVHLGVDKHRATGRERQRAIPGRRLADCGFVTLRAAQRRPVSCNISASRRGSVSRPALGMASGLP